MNNTIVKTIGKALNILSIVTPRLASKIALNLFATPRKGRYSVEQEQLLDSATLNILKYNDLDVALYYWSGNTTAKTLKLFQDYNLS